MSLVNTNWLQENIDKVKIIDCSWHMPQTKRNDAPPAPIPPPSDAVKMPKKIPPIISENSASRIFLVI